MSDHAEGSGSDEDYEVEGIVGHKDSTGSGRKYKIKWKGYEETTFEPRENLVPNSEDLVVEYDRKHPFKRSTRLASKHKQEGMSQKSEEDTIFDSESEDESKDSNIENKKPNIEAKQKRRLSERVKTKIKSHKTTRKGELSRSKKVLEPSALRNGKKKGKKKNSSMILESSDESSNEEEYEVDLLLKHRDLEDRRMYLVKWKGYPKSEATWEPSSNLSCRTLVRQYEHIRGKWKRPRQRASGSSDKQSSKRMRTSESSDQEMKENFVKKRVRRLTKRKDGTWSKESEDDTAEKAEATHANGDEKETSAADKNEKRDVSPGGEKLEKVIKADANLDVAGEEKGEEKGETKEKGEEKGETKDEVEQTKVPDCKRGSQGDSEKTKDKSPQGKKDKSSQGEKPEEDVEEKQVEDN